MQKQGQRVLFRLVLIGAAVCVLVFTPTLLAQTSTTSATTPPVAGETFPAGLGYAALTLAGGVWGVMCTVVGKLWYGREADRRDNQVAIDTLKKERQDTIDTIKKEHQAILDALKKDHQATLDMLKKERQETVDEIRSECRDDTTVLRARIEVELRERREEAEKLLREQKDIMREVMTTCAEINQALNRNSAAIERLTQAWKEAGET